MGGLCLEDDYVTIFWERRLLDRIKWWWPEAESLKKQLTCKNPKFGKKLNGHENKRSNLRFVKHLPYITG